MKWFSYILAIYFLGISMISGHSGQSVCSDSDVSEMTTMAIAAYNTTACLGKSCCSSLKKRPTETESCGHKAGDHECPPLCVCSCCGIVGAISPKKMTIGNPLPDLIVTEDGFTYNSPKGIFFQNNIWQPPRCG